jgi:hypothetical protein
MFSIGDSVEIIINKSQLNEILKTNNELRGEIMKCYNTKIGIIIDKFLPNNIINEPYYCLDIADNVCWKESELKLVSK